MAKTKKDVIYAIAEKLGGDRGQRMRAALQAPLLRDLKAWNDEISDEEFAAQVERMGQQWTTAFDGFERRGLEPPQTWGGLN